MHVFCYEDFYTVTGLDLRLECSYSHLSFYIVFSMLVVATSGTGYILGSSSSVDYLGLCCTCAGTMMVAASANSLNQVCDAFHMTSFWEIRVVDSIFSLFKHLLVSFFLNK